MSKQTSEPDGPRDLPPLPAPEPDPALVAEAVRTQDPLRFFALGLSMCQVQRDARHFRTLGDA